MIMRQRAFTLIEILIALIIISVGLYAVISAGANSTYQRIHLRDMNLANWIARDVIKEAQFGVIEFPRYKKSLTGTRDMLGQTFTWSLSREKTNDVQLLALTVTVSLQGQRITSMKGYMGGTDE